LNEIYEKFVQATTEFALESIKLMKTTLKFFAPTLLMFAFLVAFITSTATTVQAQTEDSAEVIADKNRLYEGCFLKDKAYNSTDAAVKKSAMDCGREYVKKYEAADNKEADKKAIIDYLKKKISAYDEANAKKADEDDTNKRYERFDNAYKAAKTSKNWAEVFAAGKDILAKFPDDIDTMIDLASIGYDRALENNTTFNADTLNYAKMTIAKIEAGKPSITGNYGGNIIYKTKTYADGKSNVLGWMNYIVSFVTNAGKTVTDKATAESYYKIQQFKSSEVSKFASIYQTIGSWYLAEFNKTGNDIDAKIKAAGDKETDETVQLVALQRGIADRAMEAYARAYKAAKEASMVATATAASKDSNNKLAASYLKTITALYTFRRFDKKPIVGNEVETYVTGVLAKPFTDPSAAFVPVVAPVVPVPATAPTTKPTTPTAKPTTTTPTAKPTTPPATKPGTKPATKPAVKKPRK
jgi:hypothetical protein